ncbi:FAD binding domain-containing protein [Cohnella suwonensis]|uniref:FAD binding domain-containing protein n=1 Tax=Cohnella suwonensis TaxID=696072 RepID=A0ABW0M4U0_9BACL
MASSPENTMMSPSVWHPRDVTEAWTFKRLLESDSAYVAGGTLLRTQWESGQATMPKHFIDLSGIPGLSGIEEDDRALTIGALTTLGECRRDARVAERCPMLASAIGSIAAASVRNLATVGGNVVSRVGDSLPALIVCKAEFEWCTGLSAVTEDAFEWAERLQVQLPKASNLLLRIIVPYVKATELVPRRFGAYHKVGRREAFTPSLVTVALGGGMKADGSIADITIAAGGGQTLPHRLHGAEKLLKGQPIGAELLRDVHEAVMNGYKPKSDPFATDAYRKKTAANLVVTELWKSRSASAAAGEEANRDGA